MFNVVLFEPEIPSNTGNIGRTCVVTGAHLHLVKPYGFALTDPLLRRAGMNYWHNLPVCEYADWDDFVACNPGARLHLLTKRAAKVYTQAEYRDGDFLVFGKESTGIPREILERHPACCERIPMLPDAVSLDDAPAWRERHDRLVRQDICGNFVRPALEVAGWSASGSASGATSGSGTGGRTAGEAGAGGGTTGGAGAGISSLNLSNSVAIVLYEALRQVGYPGM